MPGAKYELQRTCEKCGATFLAKNIDSRYCSRKCSNIASKERKKMQLAHQRFEELSRQVSDARDLISVPEAEAIFAISRKTIYRLIRDNKIIAVNIGQRLTRVSKSELAKSLPMREKPIDRTTALPKSYLIEPETSYTIGEISEKYRISDKSVYDAIRKHGIPMRQLGKCVYVPREEIDKLFKKGTMV